MKWFKDETFSPKEIEAEFGVKIKTITQGMIPTGEFVSGFDDVTGMAIEIPILKKGIEIDFDGEINEITLKKIDAKFMGYKREHRKEIQ